MVEVCGFGDELCQLSSGHLAGSAEVAEDFRKYNDGLGGEVVMAGVSRGNWWFNSIFNFWYIYTDWDILVGGIAIEVVEFRKANFRSVSGSHVGQYR